jgi:hypothetical protein
MTYHGIMTIQAIREIKAGEELTIPYYGHVLFLDKEHRQNLINPGDNFDCHCTACLSDDEKPFLKSGEDIKDFIEGLCIRCGKSCDELFSCEGCKSFTYCSSDCREQHWELGHKKVCKLVGSELCFCFTCLHLETIVSPWLEIYKIMGEREGKQPIIEFLHGVLASEGIGSNISQNGDLVIDIPENCNRKKSILLTL